MQSAGSNGSAASAFSNASADAVRMDKKNWKEIVELRREQADNIDRIKVEVQAMIDSCNIQKNVNMTIKDGLKKLKTLVA